jgi:hypothetical protein
LDGGDAAVLTITAFTEETISDQEGERVSPCLLFEETGDKVFWLNKTQCDYIVEALGDDSDDWVGQKIPLEATTTHYQGKAYKKLWVAAPERWSDYRDEGVRAVKVKAPKVVEEKISTAKRGKAGDAGKVKAVKRRAKK